MASNQPSRKRRRVARVPETCAAEEDALPSISSDVSSSVFDHVPAEHIPKLKRHQKEGVEFMWENAVLKSRGCILAHCMGLGKTVQVLTFVSAMFHARAAKRVVVIVPRSLTGSWRAEASRWGFSSSSNPAAHQFPLYTITTEDKSPERAELLAKWGQSDGAVLLTTYSRVVCWAVDVLPRQSADAGLVEPEPGGANTPAELDAVRNYLFGRSRGPPGACVVVVDEAQKLRNAKALMTGACRAFLTKRRVALSGTPMQNKLSELHSLIEFVRPGALSKERMLDFATPIEQSLLSNTDRSLVEAANSRAAVIHDRITSEFIHRRDHSVLTAELPPLHQTVLVLRLSRLQADLYHRLSNRLAGNSRGGVLVWRSLVYRLLLHPAALRTYLKRVGEEEGRAVAGMSGAMRARLLSDEFEWMEHVEDERFLRESPKLQAVREIVTAARDNGERVLIFSEFTEVLDVLQRCLLYDGCGGTVARIDGGVAPKMRDQLVREVQAGNVGVTLLTLGTGGLGLTLTAATRVVLLEPQWNWAGTQQAIFRAYRYGQTAPVHTYQLVADGTVERWMLGLTLKKEWVNLRVIDDESASRRYLDSHNRWQEYRPTLHRPVSRALAEQDPVMTGLSSLTGEDGPLLLRAQPYNALLSSDSQEEIDVDARDRANAGGDYDEWTQSVDTSSKRTLTQGAPSLHAAKTKSPHAGSWHAEPAPDGPAAGAALPAHVDFSSASDEAARARAIVARRAKEDVRQEAVRRNLDRQVAMRQRREKFARLQAAETANQVAAVASRHVRSLAGNRRLRPFIAQLHTNVLQAPPLLLEHFAHPLPPPNSDAEAQASADFITSRAVTLGCASFAARVAQQPATADTLEELMETLGPVGRAAWSSEMWSAPGAVSGAVRRWVDACRQEEAGAPGSELFLTGCICYFLDCAGDRLAKKLAAEPTLWENVPRWLQVVIAHSVNVDHDFHVQLLLWGLQELFVLAATEQGVFHLHKLCAELQCAPRGAKRFDAESLAPAAAAALVGVRTQTPARAAPDPRPEPTVPHVATSAPLPVTPPPRALAPAVPFLLHGAAESSRHDSVPQVPSTLPPPPPPRVAAASCDAVKQRPESVSAAVLASRWLGTAAAPAAPVAADTLQPGSW
eukprot:TRINITY_DN30639_c0_g1_i1.p1 TRINITY_DN30639_c0_g1~~TRINITY_DN30639_c0_g1_i1.p1  ORF type:complete len:1216 (+),score=320.44 TRINITY_DN30639_c0_g1_i1:250-3648(+)